MLVRSNQSELYRSNDVSLCLVDSEDSDLVEITLLSCGINDVREIIDKANQRPEYGDSQVIVIRTTFITHEAQNALLKVFEEPPETTKLVLVVPHDLALLPTLLSRLQVVSLEDNVEPSFEDRAWKDFLSSGYASRIKAIEEAHKQSDTSWYRHIKIGLMSEVKKHNVFFSISEVEFVLRYLLTRGASNKLLLEHLALVLPVRASLD